MLTVHGPPYRVLVVAVLAAPRVATEGVEAAVTVAVLRRNSGVGECADVRPRARPVHLILRGERQVLVEHALDVLLQTGLAQQLQKPAEFLPELVCGPGDRHVIGALRPMHTHTVTPPAGQRRPPQRTRARPSTTLPEPMGHLLKSVHCEGFGQSCARGRAVRNPRTRMLGVAQRCAADTHVALLAPQVGGHLGVDVEHSEKLQRELSHLAHELRVRVREQCVCDDQPNAP